MSFVDMVKEKILGIYSFTLGFQLVCNLLQFINNVGLYYVGVEM